jgi:hypothetical protein
VKFEHNLWETALGAALERSEDEQARLSMKKPDVSMDLYLQAKLR